jgi:hypothetical protein
MQRMVPAVPTPLLLEDAVHGFADAWPMGTDDPCSPEALAVMVAKSALETWNFGMDQATKTPHDPPSIYNNNLGNERPGKDYDGDVCQYPCNEVINGKVIWFKPPQPESTFRSFSNLADGCVGSIRFLAHSVKYHQAWLRMLAGDPVGYVQCAKAAGYFTGAEEPYVKAVRSIFLKALPICRRVLEGEHHGITDEDRAHVGELVMLSLAEQGRLVEADPTAPTDPAPPPDDISGAAV